MRLAGMTAVAALGLATALVACGDEEPQAPAEAPKEAKAPEAPKDPNAPPVPTVQPLEGDARPALLLAQAWFYTDAKGMPNPGPARLDIWRETEGTWGYTRVEDPDSNVFHKAVPYKGGVLTIGAEGAHFKHWTFADGAWSQKTIWFKEEGWGGKFNRLRDLEIGDVDGDGVDEFVIATHDGGVVAVVEWDGVGEATVTEMDARPDTFVHEVEIGDVDGDGKLEFFVTPSDRNKANTSQSGGVAMYSWNGTEYVRSWVQPFDQGTHAKEITVVDLDGDGRSEVFVVNEAEIDDNKQIKHPVEVRLYRPGPGGVWTHRAVAQIEDRQTRFLVPGDFDGDGKQELVAAAMKAGIFHIVPAADLDGADAWTVTRFEQTSSGFEHAVQPGDLDGDGQLELYVASDEQRELRRYTYADGAWKKELLGRLPAQILTWNITTGVL
jgi:hypothetical protein